MALMLGFSRPTPHTISDQADEEQARVPEREACALPIMMRMPPQKHRALLPDQPVRDPAAEQAQQVRTRDVHAVDRVGGAIVDAEAAVHDRRGHEQHQQRPHAVVGEALPHLREEERRQAARLAEELGTVGGIGF